MTFKSWLIIAAELLLSVIVIYVLLGKVGDANKRADDAEHRLKLAKDTIADMQTRQRDVAALDAKYTGELADAKATINQLERDVATGKRRLQLNARCPATGAPGTSSMGDASGPRLTDAAQRDYFTLRERIETVTKQVGYLQDYINTQCLN
ncbi:lysis protein [Kosakonia cowanii]|uniref:lysis protein n=1 Tax=Kosakonia cowanii TaxID=208223 RepID=UPI000B95D001|nr:lysis protein [Kosakonia cowanii]AST68969.1 lysis protein [Kosakonia cowanii]